MDDTAEDELTVRPLIDYSEVKNRQVIVRAEFKNREDKTFTGYVYWSSDEAPENRQPVIFCSNSTCLNFWNGMFTPAWEEFPEECRALRHTLPITYQSEGFPGIEPMKGVLEGIYYLNNGKTSFVI
ncbi:hypothetical protein HKW97_23905 (plasmid) [Pseudomonas luteola]|uniref:hypothetical protein n=1 Tax=Pseudomonas luteola TaxID=47886 RepID=UPI003890B08A